MLTAWLQIWGNAAVTVLALVIGAVAIALFVGKGDD